MKAKGSYRIVGENIHCTRVRMCSGKFVQTDASGRSWLLYKDGGDLGRLPLPRIFTESDDWKNGKVRHVAAAIHQGMQGSDEESAAGKSYIAAMAREQEAQGAWFLDLNVDEYSMDRGEKIAAAEWAASVIQGASAIPLSIDSSDPAVLEAGLKACDPARGKPLVNSVSLERATIIPIAAKAGARVVAGATGAERMPEGVAERVSNAKLLVGRLLSEGLEPDDIYLDPLVMPVSVDTLNPGYVIEAVRILRAELGPAYHFAPGLSNVSFGLPRRSLINQVFARLCLDSGCDGGIVDPAQINDGVLSSLDLGSGAPALARELLEGRDEYGLGWISACREEKA
jgi:5-methyltetrahydrofolate--homocysteine methyltransferase